MTLPSVLADGPEVLVSWDGTAAFTGPDDDVSEDVDGEPGIALAEGRDGTQQLSPPRVNAGSFELLNDDAKYSQENAGSPVYQRVEPNKPVLYRARHGERRLYRSHTLYRDHVPYRGVGLYPLGRHMVDTIAERNPLGDRRVRMETIGYETVLTRAPITVGVMTNPRVDHCITAVLDAAGWPADKRRTAVADTTLAYWWCDNREPWPVLLELLASEGPGTLGVDRDGVFYFENRNFRTIEDRAQTSQATYRDTNTGGLYFTDLAYDPSFKNIFNRATYTIRTRTLGSLAVIWTYGTTLNLSSGQSRTLIARPSDGNPFQNAVTPVLTTDYTVSGGTVSVSLAADSGLVAFITITATSGTPTVSALQLRAQPLTVVGETTVQNTTNASASIARYSPIPGRNIPLTLAVAGWPEIAAAAAEGVCDAWVLRQMWPRPQITLTVRNADADHVKEILSRRVSDRLTLVQASTGLEADVWINQLALSISGFQGRTIALSIGAEKCDALAGAVWDVSLWDNAAALWGV